MLVLVIRKSSDSSRRSLRGALQDRKRTPVEYCDGSLHRLYSFDTLRTEDSFTLTSLALENLYVYYRLPTHSSYCVTKYVNTCMCCQLVWCTCVCSTRVCSTHGFVRQKRVTFRMTFSRPRSKKIFFEYSR